MSSLHYKNQQLYIENVPLTHIANTFGTPCYLYSRKQLQDNWLALQTAMQDISHRICYAVKANSNLAILQLFAKNGAGFDIVSVGELERVLKAGGEPQSIIFSGVGKSAAEIQRAIECEIFCFNVESIAELNRIHEIAKKMSVIAPIGLRINPNIAADTHPYISTGLKDNKFGIPLDQVISICKQISKFTHVKLISLACHIGSQITALAPFAAAMDELISCYKHLKNHGHILSHLDIGGGIGITYQDEKPISIVDYAALIREKFSGLPVTIIIEPGRWLIGNTGVLLTRVEYIKSNSHKSFAIVDAGMTELIRPALYEAWHNIMPIHERTNEKQIYDIVGPVCESADILGKSRALSIKENDLLAICTAGAYGFTMSSNYNSRPRAPEILIDNHHTHLIRERELLTDLWHNEHMLSSV